MAKSFNDLSSRGQLTVFGLFCVAVAMAAWQMLLSPARADLATRQARATSLQDQVARVQATAAKLAALERDVRTLEASVRQTTAVLPDEKDPQDVLRHLYELAREAAIDLSTFTPKAVVTKTQYSEWPIELGLQGGYHDLGRFFDRVASMSRLMSVADLQIKVNVKPSSKNTITATCVATTFVFKKDIAPEPPTALARATPPGGVQ